MFHMCVCVCAWLYVCFFFFFPPFPKLVIVFRDLCMVIAGVQYVV